MGSHGALRAEVQRPPGPRRRTASTVQGRRGAPVGCESLHGDSGGRGEYGVKKRSECGCACVDGSTPTGAGSGHVLVPPFAESRW